MLHLCTYIFIVLTIFKINLIFYLQILLRVLATFSLKVINKSPSSPYLNLVNKLKFYNINRPIGLNKVQVTEETLFAYGPLFAYGVVIRGSSLVRSRCSDSRNFQHNITVHCIYVWNEKSCDGKKF